MHWCLCTVYIHIYTYILGAINQGFTTELHLWYVPCESLRKGDNKFSKNFLWIKKNGKQLNYLEIPYVPIIFLLLLVRLAI